MARDRGPQPVPTPPDDDPTFGTSWGPNGRDTQALRGQIDNLSSTRTSWDGDGNSGGGGGVGSGCLLVSGLLGAAGLLAAIAGAKYGVA